MSYYGSINLNKKKDEVPEYEPSFSKPFPWLPRLHKESYQCYVCIKSFKVCDMEIYGADHRIYFICNGCEFKCVECEKETTDGAVCIIMTPFKYFLRDWDNAEPERKKITKNNDGRGICYTNTADVTCCRDCMETQAKDARYNDFSRDIRSRVHYVRQQREKRAKKEAEEKAIHDLYKPGGIGYKAAKESFEDTKEEAGL